VIDFGLGALFHDVGKISIEDSILNKPGRLDLAEFEAIKRHPFFGYNKLKSAQIMTDNQLDIVLHHHEDMNGLGYPDGLSGERIHKYSRVARIVDCYDALTTKRPYKNALPGATAVEIMKKEMSQAFDQDLLKSFITFLGVDKTLKDAKKINLALGNQVLLQPEKEEFRFKAVLVGMETGDYLILRIPAHGQIQKYIYEGKRVIGRYMHSGVVYGFKTAIIGQTVHPLRLLMLKYPKSVEAIDLRKNPRIDCFFPADVIMRNKTLSGVILDISVGGCRFAAKPAKGDDLSPPKVGENVQLSAQLFGGKVPESLKGVVRNVKMEENKTELGVQFENIAPEVTKDLREFIDSVMEIVRT
jgi:c-di-GMP-binding flagellar brake protein YcgR